MGSRRAAGNCAAVEFLNGEFVSYTGEDLPIQAMANATYGASLAYVEQGVAPAFNPGASVERVAAAADMMRRFDPDLGVSPVDYSLEILTEVVVAPRKWWSNWSGEPYTRRNIVFDIARREARLGS